MSEMSEPASIMCESRVFMSWRKANAVTMTPAGNGELALEILIALAEHDEAHIVREEAVDYGKEQVDSFLRREPRDDGEHGTGGVRRQFQLREQPCAAGFFSCEFSAE